MNKTCLMLPKIDVKINYVECVEFIFVSMRASETAKDAKFSQAEDLCRRALAGSEMELGQTETLHYINRHRGHPSFAALAHQQISFSFISMFDA